MGRPLGRRKPSLPSSRPGGPLLLLSESSGTTEKVAQDKTGFVLGECQAEFELVGSRTGFHVLSIAETCPCSVGSAALSLVKGPPSCVHSSSASNFCPFVFVFKIPSFQNVCYSAGLLESPHSCLGKLFFFFSVFILSLHRKCKSLWTCWCKCSLVIFLLPMGAPDVCVVVSCGLRSGQNEKSVILHGSV